jgi:hypothetical protein
MDTRDLSIIMQNSGTIAATLLAAEGRPVDLDEFESVRLRVANGVLEFAGTNHTAVLEQQAAQAKAMAERAFNKGTGGSGGGSAAPAQAGRVKVLKPLEGANIPDWLESQVESLIGQGKIPDTSVVEVWDNRKFLTEFGGDRDKGSWFTTKYKAPGEKWGVSIWPPKGGS